MALAHPTKAIEVLEAGERECGSQPAGVEGSGEREEHGPELLA
jgi:hypothetical protein